MKARQRGAWAGKTCPTHSGPFGGMFFPPTRRVTASRVALRRGLRLHAASLRMRIPGRGLEGLRGSGFIIAAMAVPFPSCLCALVSW